MVTINLLFQWPVLPIYFTIILIALYWYLYRNLSYWRNKGIPGPQPIPLFGNIHSYFLKSIPEVELEWYQKYGKIFGLYNGENPVISVATPELIKQILVKDFHIFRNRRQTTNNPYLSKMLVLARDDDWKKIRSIASPTFTSGKLKKMWSLIGDCCDDLVQHLDRHVNNSNDIELKKFNGAYTLDVIAKCAFATNVNTYEENEFIRKANKLFNTSFWVIAFMYVLPRFVMKSKSFRRLVSSSSRSADFFVDVIRHVIHHRKSNECNGNFNDFLQLLIDAEQTDENVSNFVAEEESNESYKRLSNVLEKNLTENEIIAQCFIFLLAGFETTSSTLSFCFYELAINRTIQQKLYEEIIGCKDLSYDTLLELPYLDAVVCETLRKYPPLLRLEREAMDDVVLGDTGIVMPKGMIAEIPVYAIHYDPENYRNPHHFIPERFLAENRSHIKPYTYLPFGTGPRNCIGMRFALLEAKLAIANILRKFQFFKSPNTEIPLNYNTGRGLLAAKKLIVGIETRNTN